MALLAACGAQIHFANANKQVADIGSICHLLFDSDVKTVDSNRSEIRDKFLPLPSDSSTNKTLQTIAADNDINGKAVTTFFEKSAVFDTTTTQQDTGFSLLQSWGGIENNRDKSSENSEAEVLLPEIAPVSQNALHEVLLGNQSDLSSMTDNLEPTSADNFPPPVNTVIESRTTNSISEEQNNLVDKNEQDLSGTEESDETVSQPDNVYKHLTDAITDLLNKPPATKNTDLKTKIENKPIDDQKEYRHPKPDKWPAIKSFDKLRAFSAAEAIRASKIQENMDQNIVSEERSVFEQNISDQNNLNEIYIPEQNSSSTLSLGDQSNSETSAEPMLNTPNIISEDYSVTADGSVAIFSSVEMVPSKLDDFQEPKVVMNEMASLMSKLESQVARAAKKLAVKASEVEVCLSANLDALHVLVNQEDKDSYAELVVRIDVLSKQFESLFDSLKTELAEKAASNREQIKTKLATYQKRIDETENEKRDLLIEECKQNKIEFAEFVKKQEGELNNLIEVQTTALHERVQTLNGILEEVFSSFSAQLEGKFANFKERVEYKIISLLNNFDSKVAILNKDIDYSQLNAIEQLNWAKNEFFSKVERLVQVSEIDLSRQIRKAQVEAFLPRLKERKQIIEAMMHEMMQTFAEHSFSQAKAQSEGAEHSLVLARQQLKELVEERLAKLDMIGRNQQNGLEEIFKSAADPLEQNTATVMQLVKNAEQEIEECEILCTKLAQSYNLDGDPKLSTLRQDIYSKTDAFKVQLKNHLESILNDNCLKLEDLTKSLHIELNTQRSQSVQQVRSASESGLLQIREAIHDAFHTIQSQREKHME